MQIAFLSMLLVPIIAAAQEQAATDPEKPQTLELRRAEEQKTLEASLKGVPEMPSRKLEELFAFALHDGFIVVHPKLAEATDGMKRIDVPELPGITTLMMIGDPAGPADRAVGINLQNYRLDQPGVVYANLQVLLQPTHLQLALGVVGETETWDVSLLQQPPHEETPAELAQVVRMYVQVFDANEEQTQRLSLAAPTFSELRRKHPAETQKYLYPIMHALQAEHLFAVDERLGWRVLAEDLEPDKQLVRQVETILEQFDSDRFQEREAAAQELRKLGQPAAIALLKADRSDWSIERQSGVDAFLAEFTQGEQDDAAAMRDSPAFLLDCLYSDNADLRSAAAARLQKITDEPVEIDPDAPREQRFERIAQLYEKLVLQNTDDGGGMKVEATAKE
jgi:hypothetical protein